MARKVAGIAKKMINPALRRLGYRLAPAVMRLSMGDVLQHLKGLGLEAQTIIDVGVGYGTPELYDAFPGASFVLVEPLREFEPSIRAITTRYAAHHINAAAGSVNGSTDITVYPGDLQASSRFSAVGEDRAEVRTVQMVRLDTVVKPVGPTVLKIDVQGSELDVLKGCEGILQVVVLVLVEVGVTVAGQGAPAMTEVIQLMSDRGFVPYDFYSPVWRPRDLSLAHIDVAFLPRNSRLRQVASWF